MSKDKHKGVARRKFALANISKVTESKRMTVHEAPEPSVKRRRHYPQERILVSVDITKAVKELEKKGKISRIRIRKGFTMRITRFKDADGPNPRDPHSLPSVTR